MGENIGKKNLINEPRILGKGGGKARKKEKNAEFRKRKLVRQGPEDAVLLASSKPFGAWNESKRGVNATRKK